MMGPVGVSLWIALVTVVPGLVTIAAVFGAVAVAAMVVTQALVGGALYVGLLVVLLWASYRVAVARFRVMVQSVWMLRQSS